MRQGGCHLAHGHQAARGFELFLLQCGQLLGALALADVEHRAHPAQLAAVGGSQRCFVDQHVHAVAAAVLELHLDALGLRALADDRAVQQCQLVGLVGGPVGQGGAGAAQLLCAVAHHGAEGLVHVEDLARHVPGAHADGDRALHGRAQCHLGLQALLHLLALDEVAPQRGQAGQHAQQKQQRDDKEDARHGRGLRPLGHHFQHQVGAGQVHHRAVGALCLVGGGRVHGVHDQAHGLALQEPRRQQGVHRRLGGQRGHIDAHQSAAVEVGHREPDAVGGAAIEAAHGPGVAGATQPADDVLQRLQGLEVVVVLGLVVLPGAHVACAGALRGQPGMGQHHTGCAPQHACGRAVAFTLARSAQGLRAIERGLPRQCGEVVFQAAKVELHALLQPLGVGAPAALFFLGFEAVEVPHQRHHGRDDQHHQAHHPQHGPAAPVAQGAFAGVQQGKVVRGLGGQGHGGVQAAVTRAAWP